jgi:hypothetical protein
MKFIPGIKDESGQINANLFIASVGSFEGILARVKGRHWLNFLSDQAISVLFIITLFANPCRAQSAAEAAEDIQRKLNSVKSEIVSNLQAAIANPEKLQTGQTQAGCVNALAKLDEILARTDETIDLLAKRDADLAAKTGVGQAEKLELKQALQSQRRPLEANKQTARQLKSEVSGLLDSKLGSIAETYSSYRDIAGPEKARERVEARLTEILAPYLPRKAKSPPPSVSSSSLKVPAVSSNAPDFSRESVPKQNNISTRSTPKPPRPVWRPKDKLPKDIQWHGVAGSFAFIGSSRDGSVILVPAEDANHPFAREFWIVNRPYAGGANVLLPSHQRRIIDIPHLQPLIILGRGSSPGVYRVTMP